MSLLKYQVVYQLYAAKGKYKLSVLSTKYFDILLLQSVINT